MSIKKQYLKSKPVCKVTFRLPRKTGDSFQSANVVGEFNEWDTQASSMNRLKNGSFVTTIDLEWGENTSSDIFSTAYSGKMMQMQKNM
jgi:hypothetical protein